MVGYGLLVRAKHLGDVAAWEKYGFAPTEFLKLGGQREEGGEFQRNALVKPLDLLAEIPLFNASPGGVQPGFTG